MTNRPLPENAHMIPDTAERVFKGTIFDVYHWQQEMFDGTFETFEMLRRPDTTLVIVIDDNEIVLLDEEQPATPIQNNRLPGGRVEPNELPLAAAKREIEEEIGMQFENWVLLDVSQPVLKMEWFVYVYVATGKISDIPTAHESGEKIVVKKVSFDDFKRLHSPAMECIDEINSINELQKKIELLKDAAA